MRDTGPRGPIRRIEHGLINVLATLGFKAKRRDTPPGQESAVGVWTPDHREIASIGMRMSGGVTSHGFALDIDPDLSTYTTCTACALRGTPMTSLARLAASDALPMPCEVQVRDAVADAVMSELGCAGDT